MRRNVAGQFVGAQMISASDGSAFTGAVTVAVTGDAGTQATGSVGSGACTHEGNGFHTYAPAQAETNYTHVAFTFTGTGAIPVSVQIYPISYDASGRMDVGMFGGTAGTFASGRPEVNTSHIAGSAVSTSSAQIGVNVVNAAGTAWGSGAITAASIAADAITAAKVAADVTTEIQSGLATAANLATVAGYLDTEIAAILADTNELQTDWANGGRLDLLIDGIKAKTDNLPTDPADASDVAAAFSSLQSHGDSTWSTATGFSTLNAAGVRSALGMSSANLDTQLADLPTAAENADALIGRNIEGGSSSGRTVAQALAFIRNKWSISAGTLTVYGVDDSTSSWTASVTQTSANPVSAVDPS